MPPVNPQVGFLGLMQRPASDPKSRAPSLQHHVADPLEQATVRDMQGELNPRPAHPVASHAEELARRELFVEDDERVRHSSVVVDGPPGGVVAKVRG